MRKVANHRRNNLLQSEPSSPRVISTAEMHRAAGKCIKTGALRLRGEIDPIRVESGIRLWGEFL